MPVKDEVLLEIRNGIALITLNRPTEHNTLTAPMITALGEAYRQCDGDGDVKDDVVRIGASVLGSLFGSGRT